jgi:hypothetical protein
MENAPPLRTEPDPGPLLDRLLLRGPRHLVLWALVVALFAAQWYLHDWLFSGGHPWPAIEYVRWSFLRWLAWVPLAPLVFRLADRFPVDSPLRLRFLGLHLAASVAVTAFSVAAGALLSHWLLPDRPPFEEQLRHFAGKYALIDFLAYWMLVSIRQTVHFYREKNRRELESSRLATELAQSRLQVLKMQLQPHFLFNTLHTIGTLIDEDPAAAEEMLLRLSELLRAFLEDYRGQEIPLGHELELVDLYLGIQRTRFKDRLTTRIHAAPDTLDCAVPSLILQPLAENAIQHGIGRNVGEDCIEIHSRIEGEQLCLEVRNRNSALERISTGTYRRGIGLSNSRLRLKELYGDAAQIQLAATAPHGVVCRVRLPVRRLDLDDLVRPGGEPA